MGKTVEHEQIKILVSRVENQLKELNISLFALAEKGVSYSIDWHDYRDSKESDFYHKIKINRFQKLEKF